MNYITVFDIYTFQFWSGAEETVKEVAAAGKMEELGTLVEERFAGKTPTKTEINDFVWFCRDEIMDMFGIED